MLLAALASLAEGLCFILLPAVKTEESTIILAGTRGHINERVIVHFFLKNIKKK
jgi:hypothetical protein